MLRFVWALIQSYRTTLATIVIAMLIGIEDYERLAGGRRDFWEAYEEFRQEFDLAELGIDPDEIFGDVRDSSPGREFSW